MANLIHTLPKWKFLCQFCYNYVSQFQQFWITVYDAGLEEKF